MSRDHSQNHYGPNASFDGYDSDLASAGILIESLRQQLSEAYEAGKRDAVPEGWVLVPKEPTFPMLIELNEVAIEVAGLGYSDGPQKILTEGYAAMLAAAPKGLK